jgi:hypothetical protein
LNPEFEGIHKLLEGVDPTIVGNIDNVTLPYLRIVKNATHGATKIEKRHFPIVDNLASISI